MHKNTKYLSAKFTHSDGSGRLVSLAIIALTGEWFYCETVGDDIVFDAWSQINVAPKLKKIPRTKFLREADVVTEAKRWLAENGISEISVSSLGQSLRIASQLSDALQVIPRTSAQDKLLAEYYAHCGGESRVRNNALIDAIGLAVCDSERDQELACGEIQHLELLLGSKNAMSYRAWVRRHEREKFPLAAPAKHEHASSLD